MGKTMSLSDAQRHALAWVADHPDGRAMLPTMPDDVSFTAIRELREARLIREFKGLAGFTGVRITDKGRDAAAEWQQKHGRGR